MANRSHLKYGHSHLELQEYDCKALNGIEDLLKILSSSSVLNNWEGSVEALDEEKVLTWFPCDDRVAFYVPNENHNDVMAVTYRQLQENIRRCPKFQERTVAIILPNDAMASMATALLCVMNQSTAVPLDCRMAPSRLMEALEQLEATSIVTTPEIWESIQGQRPDRIINEVRYIRQTPAGDITWTFIKGIPPKSAAPSGQRPMIMLRTSGTTAQPKIVPLTGKNLLYNALCISSSLELTRDDIDLNAMPLYHIGGISCALLSVLVSGSSVFWHGSFDPARFLDELSMYDPVVPTWYYGVPTMHKALMWTMKTGKVKNNLRFIRSGAAHISHETAMQMSRQFDAAVLPTYSMSESMPVCSCQTAIVHNQQDYAAVDTVGVPIGRSAKIVDTSGRTLRLGGGFGEVAIRGPGVMSAYQGISPEATHTPDGWLLTGDIGYLDGEGNLFLKGRTKEVIKRGGEQVWPIQIDDIVQQIKGVREAVAFGVPNELWGEEVAVAVVLDEGVERDTIQGHIIEVCSKKLDPYAVPVQVIVVQTTDELPKGRTGKYLRNDMAKHLGIHAVDLAAQGALQRTESLSKTSETLPPSEALNGIRFIVACFVVQIHVGLYPNLGWIKAQSYSLNMIAFFVLGAFQLTCNVGGNVLDQWARFVGTKIGAMHALFVIVQFLALPSFLLFQCGAGGYKETFEDGCDGNFWASNMAKFFFATATGIIVENPVNPVTWFQSAFYTFLLLFPLLDKWFRHISSCGQAVWLAVLGALSSVIAAVVFFTAPQNEPLNILVNFTVVGWLPTLLSAMILGYMFTRSTERIAKGWAVATDILSIVLLLLLITAIRQPDCLTIRKETFADMRQGEEIPPDNSDYVYTCDITYDEFVEFIHPDPEDPNTGRFVTPFSGLFGFLRVGTPLMFLWIFGLSFGRGITAWMLEARVLSSLSHLAYSVYLLHVPIARYYWMATRGREAEFWWPMAASYPFPLEWYELLVIIGICVALGALIDKFLTPRLMPHSVKLGVAVLNCLSRCMCCCCSRRGVAASAGDEATPPSTYNEIQQFVKGLTSLDVSRDTNLRDLGLDSLGATALLGTIRASVDKASDLRMRDLVQCETVGELADILDDHGTSSAGEEDFESSPV